jgi:tungstate transport system permease protein
LFGLPPVVGLILYLTLSHSGPLGFLDLLFTPTAMVTAQRMLAIPIITALVHRASERAWARYGDELISDGASRTQAIPQILSIIRAELLTAILAGPHGLGSRGGHPGRRQHSWCYQNHDDDYCSPNQPGRSR